MLHPAPLEFPHLGGHASVAKLSHSNLRRQLATIFEDEEPRSRITWLFDTALAALIVVNVSCVILESVEPIRDQLGFAFDLLERAATAVWACVDLREPSYRDPLWGRLRYMRSFFALIDLVSVLPAILGFFGAADLRVLRLLRLLRMLKLVRHSTTFGLLFAALREERQSISALLFVLLLTVTIAGSLMFMIENERQPEVFTSIPVAMWWAIETLTTVGYGDIVPMTASGRVIGGVVSIVGIGTLALFSGLITVGFLDQLRNYREQHARPHVVIAEKSIAVAQNFVVTAAKDAREGATGPAVCPHCGAAIAASAAAHRPGAEPLRA
jgi:voltage-gated potassium channel